MDCFRVFLRTLAIALMIAVPSIARADAGVQTAWRLLDYISVDYAGAIAKGRVTNPTEYAEQQEFAATVRAKIAALRLRSAIDSKAEPSHVADIAHGLAASLLAAIRFRLPRTHRLLSGAGRLCSRNIALPATA